MQPVLTSDIVTNEVFTLTFQGLTIYTGTNKNEANRLYDVYTNLAKLHKVQDPEILADQIEYPTYNNIHAYLYLSTFSLASYGYGGGELQQKWPDLVEFVCNKKRGKLGMYKVHRLTALGKEVLEVLNRRYGKRNLNRTAQKTA